MAGHLLNILNVAGLRAVFITLAHSLWLGAVLAVLAGIVIVLTKRSGSLVRYRLLTALLMLFAISIVYIFYRSLTVNAGTFINSNVTADTSRPGFNQADDLQQRHTVWYSLLAFTWRYTDIIISIWYIVVCFKCARLICGLRELQKLKKAGTIEAGAYWIERIHQLAASLGVTKQVTLLQSSLAKVPMIIGHLKPVILLPVGILNALPAAQIEAILLHELAHIRRNDFLINLLQQFIEIFFFFNPGVLWVSSLVKNERENCCDDMAIGVTHDKKIFIHALVAFQEYKAGLSMATTFSGSGNHLLNRVKRIITSNNKTLNNMEKLMLASGIVVTGLVALAFYPGPKVVKNAMVKTAAITGADNTTVKGSKPKSTTNATLPENGYNKGALHQRYEDGDTTTKTHYSGVIDGKKIRLKEENGKVKELYVDGKKIPADQYDRYAGTIDKVHADMRENADRLKIESGLLRDQEKEIEQQETLALSEEDEMKDQNNLQQKEELNERNDVVQKEELEARAELLKEDMKNQHEQMEKNRNEMQKEIKLSKKNGAMMRAQSKKMQADLIRQQKQLQLKQVDFQKQVEKMELQQKKINEMMKDSISSKKVLKDPAAFSSPGMLKLNTTFRSAITVKPGVLLLVKPVPLLAPVPGIKPVVYITSSSISNDIMRDLEKANVISTRKNLSFRITNNELVVNGVKQTDAVHEQILEKYVKKPGDEISFSYINRQ